MSERSLTDFNGKRVTLVGFGTRTNVALARELVRRGAIVTLNDRKPAEQLRAELALVADLPVRLVLGGHHASAFDGADCIFVSPGVPRELPVLVEAKSRGVPISSEIELLFADCPVPIVGVTGSSGKTTTTTLVGEMLRATGRPTYVGGNIGLPLIDQLHQMPPDAIVVLELSSFQLENLTQSPSVAAMLNLSPNHLDRHGTMERYFAAKLNILAHQGPDDTVVLGRDNDWCQIAATHARGRVLWFSRTQPVGEGACLRGDQLVLRRDGREQSICAVSELRLLGEHNVSNVLAAACVASAAGAGIASIREVAISFTGVEHRLEPVRTLDGVTYYNDSIATAPERAVAALRAMTRPVVLIAGGQSKHLPLDELIGLLLDRGRALVTIGTMAEELEEAVRMADPAGRLPVVRAGSLDRAVEVARSLAQPGDVVLLSPAGTSFDAYRDFEERGRHFKACVAALSQDNQ